MRFGAHVSIAGGMSAALERAKDLHISVFQIFSRSPRGKGGLLSEKEIKNFRQRYKELTFQDFYLHSPYYVNLASANPKVWHSSISSLVEALKVTELLGANYLVVHTGNHRGQGVEEGIKRVAKALKGILSQTSSTTTLLLENTAGQGTAIGCRWEEIASIIESCGVEERLGTCMDTCHAFASGYDIRTKDKIDETLAQFDRIIGLARLKLLHGNDSKGALGSRLDRHEHIGRGRIGLAGFQALVNHPALQHLDMIIETPKMGSGSDRENLDILARLVGQEKSFRY
jgi:deoxyribonuclease-4